MTTQPEALRLADKLESDQQGIDLGAEGMGWGPSETARTQAAFEFRRLYGINQDLLEVLQTIVSTERDRHGYHPAWTDQARAAIAKARGEK